ncbi:MAG: replicative DNA helicase, partial [Candidatus Aenigmarchaeota archaeon]|nr:replicative DNA helicase [Candidatus Aenigmarchaeota archaeon]
ELNIPVVSAAQLRRDAENRKPTLADFSDSSQIEKDADGVVMIYHTENSSYLCIEKNRDGETGDFPVYFKKEYVTFTERQEA